MVTEYFEVRRGWYQLLMLPVTHTSHVSTVFIHSILQSILSYRQPSFIPYTYFSVIFIIIHKGPFFFFISNFTIYKIVCPLIGNWAFEEIWVNLYKYLIIRVQRTTQLGKIKYLQKSAYWMIIENLTSFMNK